MRRLAAAVMISWGLCLCAAGAAAQEVAPYDPYKAEKSVEVGLYYFKKKNYDAAIERFKDAIRFKPNFARPHKLLGQCFEKKRERQEAIEWYEKYLEILPAAEDAASIRKRIAKLHREIQQEAERRKRRSG
jgi:tetratricopeptide (TPR) repeat protein